MKQKLISKQIETIVTLKNYYRGLRLIELRHVYLSLVNKDMDRAALNRMDSDELINKIVEKTIKPLDI